jgi:DNA-binding transcriptional MerR regulator
MQLKEACERSKTTRKALEYYATKNLIQPKVLENGYRDYSEADISRLKEISVLRKCGISIADIKEILDSPNKESALAKCKYLTEIRLSRLATIQKCMTNLVKDYDVEREFDYLQEHNDDLFTIKERIVLEFPGNYGLFLALHFGRFLNEVVDTEEKREAYDAIIKYLDSVNLHIPTELSELMETFFTVSEKIGAEKLESTVHETMTEAVADFETYLDKNHKMIEEYIEYKTSEQYKKSPEAALQKLMINFQKESGYHEMLIGNIKILSNSYTEYLERVEKADAKLLEKFPQAKDMYNFD